ncbi:hypothetical protein [Zhihengliuella halotolerans]|uniref:hypothetical protein n=1 Tax=Zhihengliuella halotolerans TaxID=370736 RepID=UPI000C80D8BF|nr:hypothetical protein [Zhihengliuella halotolerans]
MSTTIHEPITAAVGGAPPTNGSTTVAAGDEQGQPRDDDRLVLVGYDKNGQIRHEVDEHGIWFDIEDPAGSLDDELRSMTGVEDDSLPVFALDFDPAQFDEEPMTDPDNEEGRDVLSPKNHAAAVNETPQGATNMHIIAETPDKFSSENLTWSQAQSIANTIGFLDRTVDPTTIADELYASRGMQAVDDLVAHLTTFMGRLDAEYTATANPDEEEQLRGEAA